MNSGIYCIENKVNGKKYIGQSAELNERKRSHFSMLKNGNHYNRHLQNAYNKYGKKNFEFKVILYAEPNELTKYEQGFIDKHKPEELYNICLECVNSPLGVKASDETRRKLSIVHTGKPSGMKDKHHSEETKKKLSIARAGKRHNEEAKRKISIAMTGKPSNRKGKHHSEEAKRKISIARAGKPSPMKGKHHSKETKRKQSIAMAGKNHYLYGKHPSEETRRKKSIALKKYWAERKRLEAHA